MPRSDVFDAVRPSQVSVTCLGRQWDLRLRTAYQWIGAVGYDLDTLAGVLPGAIHDDDVEQMCVLALQHDDCDDRWLNAARVALGRAGGRDWWWVYNLVRKSLSGWVYINGRLMLSGVDSRRTMFPEWLDSAYMMLWSGSDEEHRIKLDLELSLPPRGVAIRRDKKQTVAMLEAFASD